MYDCTDCLEVECKSRVTSIFHEKLGEATGATARLLPFETEQKKKCLEEYGSGFQIITCGIPSLHYKVGYLI